MSYVPQSSQCDLPNSESPITAARVAAQDRYIARVGQTFVDNNNAMDYLVGYCCSDSARGGPGDTSEDSAAAVAAAAIASGAPSVAGSLLAPVVVTPSGAGGAPYDPNVGPSFWPTRARGGPFPRPRVRGGSPGIQFNSGANYPQDRAAAAINGLVPPCPCFSSAPAVVMPTPVIATPAPAPAPAPAPPPAAAPCPYPGCSNGNVCLDLVSGCVQNSQVTQAQVEACTLAGYSVFGNQDLWGPSIALANCAPLPFLGAPLPNPPPATGAMIYTIKTPKGVAGLGAVPSGGNLFGVLALLALVGWAAVKK